LAGEEIPELGQPGELQHLFGPVPHLGLGEPLDLQPDLDVVVYRAPGQALRGLG
jgi:hypothetical protein